MSRLAAIALVGLVASACDPVGIRQVRGPTLPDDANLAPDFELTDQRGDTVSLWQALERGPVALVFYRGHW